ncbi:serine hydrolase family protein [Gracilibacillus salitolerans]|uniref:Serine hydrolase family protein n=1 Tax=Gracilibacillus salitolerans TaxID=2663022 RepID=A0A5Q2TE37_9BACI|nr:alpha/beta hydrolase [Gracilibacillus salitolerans]QGH32895.1 serine hydrolase family protein [Gracilibacillus salitolerans]
MKKQILFVHSAGAQGLHQGSRDLIEYLLDQLGDTYHLISPMMPKPENPEYARWKNELTNIFSHLEGEIILIGHSLGGSVLLKYLSEMEVKPAISSLFLIASPYWGKDDDWQAEEFTLTENFTSNLPYIPNIYLYHSKDDKVVPVTHIHHYANEFPQAITRVLEREGHYFSDGIPDLITDIKE